MKRLVVRLGLLVVVVALVTFAWQTAYARGLETGKAEVSALRTEFIQARQGGAGVVGQRPGLNGVIERVDGAILTVATSDGTVTVILSDQTRIGKQTTIGVGDLRAGDRVLLAGEPRGDTTYSATTIQVQEPAGR